MGLSEGVAVGEGVGDVVGFMVGFMVGSNVGLSGYSLEVLHNVDVRSQVEEVDGAYETQERKDPNWKGERDCCEACVAWAPPKIARCNLAKGCAP